MTSPKDYLTDRVEAIYKTYVQAEDTHSECDDACSHKYYEKQNRIDFVKDVLSLLTSEVEKERELLLKEVEEKARTILRMGLLGYEVCRINGLKGDVAADIILEELLKDLSDIGGGK